MSNSVDEIRNRFLKLESKIVEQGCIKKHLWTLCSLLGETFYKRYPPKIGVLNYLNLGAGSVNLHGFVCADFYRLYRILKRKPNEWYLDITKRIKCHDEYWDGIIVEHTNEHITYSENILLFSELYRTLKTGCKLRIVVPDLDIYLLHGELSKTSVKMQRYKSLPEAIFNLTQCHRHRSVWNYALFKEVLTAIGFTSVIKSSYMSSEDKNLLVDSENHRWQSVYVEATK